MKLKGFILGLGFLVFLSSFCIGFLGNCQGKPKPLTQSYIQQITRTPSTLPQGMEQVYKGCEVVPATGRKPQFEGQEFTGKTCFVEIKSDDRVEVSFLGRKSYSLSLLEPNSDSFVSQIGGDEVLILQIHFHRKQILSVTHTDYDRNHYLNYGASGGGEFIKACLRDDSYPSCTY